MKLLLDEQLPHDLRRLLLGHEAYTVTYMQWSGLRNGDLLAKAASKGFDAVITNDAGMADQQSRESLPVAVLHLAAVSNRIEDLSPLIPRILTALAMLRPRGFNRLPE